MLKIVSAILLSSVACASGIYTKTGTYNNRVDSLKTGKIIIDLNKTGQNIDRKFYGSHLNSHLKVPKKDYIDELQLGKLRVGGNEYDVFNWKTEQTILVNGEIKTINGIKTIATALNQYGVDGIYQINLTGVQPISLDGKTVIKNNFTAEKAYELVKYLNGEQKLNIVDFSLGNEFSVWHETHTQIWPIKDGITADEYIDRYIAFALAIRRAQKEVNGNSNSIKIWGPEISSSWLDWNTGNFSKDCAWTDIPGQVACSYGHGKYDHFIPYFLDRLKKAESDKSINPNGEKLLDYLSIHYYPNFRTKISDPHSVITNGAGRQLVAEMLEATRLLHDPTYVNTIDMSSFRKINPNILGRVHQWIKGHYPNALLAINEFAIDSDYRSTSYHPIIRPLYMADSIGIFAKENVSFFNQFMLNSEKETDMPWSMLVNETERQNSFYMYKLFSNYFKGKVLNVDDNLGDAVNAYATLEGDFVNLAIVNKDPIEQEVQIYLKNFWNKKVLSYVVPGWSASVLQIEKKTSMSKRNFKIYQYGAKEMGIPLDMAYSKNKQ